MIELRSVSASSINKFVDCKRQWAKNYDQKTKVYSTNEAATRGTLIHKALEIWRDPSLGHAQTFEALEQCYESGCILSNVGESYEVYRTGKEMLKKFWRLHENHPAMPMDRTHLWSVEHTIDGWMPEGQPLPVKGFIDTLELVWEPNNPRSVALIVGDYKSGKAKTKDELLDDIQSQLYMAYGVSVLKPQLEAQGYTVTSVMGVWTYINEETCVVLRQDEFDIPMVVEYLANVTTQMIRFSQEYNRLASEPDKLATWLEKQATTNAFCGWCPYKGTCGQMQRAYAERAVLDIFAPGITIEAMCAERDLYALAATDGENKRREIDRVLRHHIEEKQIDEIEANGTIYYPVTNKDKVIDPRVLVHVFGVEFIVANGKITLDAIKNQLDVLKITRPSDFEQAKQIISEHTTEQMGARYIRTKRAKPPREPKRAKKTDA